MTFWVFCGVGWKDNLNQIGIQYALDLKEADPKHMKPQFGVVMERIRHLS